MKKEKQKMKIKCVLDEKYYVEIDQLNSGKNRGKPEK